MRLTAWLAPLTPFTMEEAWTTRFPDADTNCARVIPETPDAWRNEAEAARWQGVQAVLETVNEALEAARRDKLIGGALDEMGAQMDLIDRLQVAYDAIGALLTMKPCECDDGLIDRSDAECGPPVVICRECDRGAELMDKEREVHGL